MKPPQLLEAAEQEEKMQRKFDPKVFQLGYVALGTPDIMRTRDHYLQNLGMTEVARADDGSIYLSIGYKELEDRRAQCMGSRVRSQPCGRLSG